MRLARMTIALAMVTLLGAACTAATDNGAGSSSSQDAQGSTGPGSSGPGPGSSGPGPASSSSTGPDDVLTGGGLGGGPGGGTGGSSAAGAACATESSQAGLEQVYLAFAFDVSASMGSNGQPYWDRTLKWDPVVAATKEFFGNTQSTGLTASLTFFPSAGSERQRCASETYTTPNVPMTALPSNAFATALDAMTPQVATRMSTPTAFVMEGTIAFVEAERQRTPGKYVIVLVTDGYPEYCNSTPEANSIDAVVPHVEAARANDISTFVIGVANPPLDGAPDTVTNLQAIAAAGGSEKAFIIDTGNPEQTASAFKLAIDQIRGSAVSCTIPIPPPPDGRTFDKQKVSVKYTRGANGTPTVLVYDQECSVGGAWRYNDPANPTSIVLCEDSCTVVQADFEVSLGVDFTCEDVIQVPL